MCMRKGWLVTWHCTVVVLRSLICRSGIHMLHVDKVSGYILLRTADLLECISYIVLNGLDISIS